MGVFFVAPDCRIHIKAEIERARRRLVNRARNVMVGGV